MVRPAKSDDSSAIAELYLNARTRHVAFAQLAHSDQEIRNWIKEELIPAGGTYVCAEDMTIVGFISVSKRDGISWIDQLYVSPERLKAGFGSILLCFAKQFLTSPIRLYTFQANEAARKFYEKKGFRPLEFSDGSQNEERCPDVLM
jgi:ribosomal protein S18 acetylase RimI-like enzyme